MSLKLWIETVKRKIENTLLWIAGICILLVLFSMCQPEEKVAPPKCECICK